MHCKQAACCLLLVSVSHYPLCSIAVRDEAFGQLDPAAQAAVITSASAEDKPAMIAAMERDDRAATMAELSPEEIQAVLLSVTPNNVAKESMPQEKLALMAEQKAAILVGLDDDQTRETMRAITPDDLAVSLSAFSLKLTAILSAVIVCTVSRKHSHTAVISLPTLYACYSV